MEGFSEMVRVELTATDPPRKVGFRNLGDCLPECVTILFSLGFAIFLGFFDMKCLAYDLAIGKGVPVTAQITHHSTGIGKRGSAYYLQISFPDEQGQQQSSEIQVPRQGFENNQDGGTLAIHYLPGFTQWPVWDQDPPNPRLSWGVFILTLMILLCVFIPIKLLYTEFQIFKKGIFVKGTIMVVKEVVRRYTQEVIRVEYVLDGKICEKTITRGASDDSLEKEAAVVVFSKNDNVRVFLNNSNGTVLRAEVPDSYWDSVQTTGIKGSNL